MTTQRIAISLAILVLTAGCQTRQQLAQQPITVLLPSADSIPGSTGASQQQSQEAPDNQRALDARLFKGSNQFVADQQPHSTPKIHTGDAETSLNLQATPIQEVIDTILGHILKKNYMVSPGVSGEITFSTASPIHHDQLLPLLQTLLSWTNAEMVLVDEVYQIVPRGQAIKGTSVPSIAARQPEDGFHVRVIPLEYISATAAAETLGPFVRDGAILASDDTRHLLMLTGTASEIARYQEIIDLFDIDLLQGMSFGVFPVQSVSVETLLTELETAMGLAEGPLGGTIRMLALERLNALLVISTQSAYLDTVKSWVERLDTGLVNQRQLHVYQVRNVEATTLAPLLESIFSGGNVIATANNSGQVAPGLTSGEIGSQPRSQPAAVRRSSGQEDSVRVIAVEETNSIVIFATAAEYESMLATIRQLDAVPLQVMIQVHVLEVTLEDALSYGVEWFFGNALNFLPGDPRPPIAGETRPPSNGSRSDNRFGAIDNQTAFSYALSGADTGVVLQALERTGLSKTIASPTLMVVNNKEATINVGDQIPVVTTAINPGTGQSVSTSNVQFRDTGISLTVTPRVNPGNLIYLQIQQDFSVPAPPDQADSTGNVRVRNRSLNTEIAVQSGSTLVLGGLIQEIETDGYTGVPVLSRVPVLGNLFKSQSKSQQRTELVLLIRPFVVSDDTQAQQLLVDYTSGLRELKSMVQSMTAPAATQAGPQ